MGSTCKRQIQEEKARSVSSALNVTSINTDRESLSKHSVKVDECVTSQYMKKGGGKISGRAPRDHVKIDKAKRKHRKISRKWWEEKIVLKAKRKCAKGKGKGKGKGEMVNS